MTPKELIAIAMKTAEVPSKRQLAERLGIDHTLVSRWETGERVLQFEDAMRLAQLAGLPPASTAAKVRLETTKDRDLRTLLQQLSKSAAVLLLALFAQNGNCKTLQVSTGINLHNERIVYKGVGSARDCQSSNALANMRSLSRSCAPLSNAPASQADPTARKPLAELK